MLLQPIPTATLAARQSSGESPFPSRCRRRRCVLLPIRADSIPIPLSVSDPSRPAKPAACTADDSTTPSSTAPGGESRSVGTGRRAMYVCFASVWFGFFVTAKMVFDLIWRCVRAGSR